MKTDLSQVHIIGFSLGAHVAGFTGKHFGGRIGRITGLDPAAPGFILLKPHLANSDARFVDVLHTAGMPTSLDLPIGHADFYPNNLKFEMPGCEGHGIVQGQKCSHFRAVEYFTESIGRPNAFLARYADPYPYNWPWFELISCLGNAAPYLISTPVIAEVHTIINLDLAVSNLKPCSNVTFFLSDTPGAHMGEVAGNEQVRGVFQVRTNANRPYSQS